MLKKRCCRSILRAIVYEQLIDSHHPTPWSVWRSPLYPGDENPGDILEMLAEMVSVNEILADFPDLELADIQACLLFAARL